MGWVYCSKSFLNQVGGCGDEETGWGSGARSASHNKKHIHGVRPNDAGEDNVVAYMYKAVGPQ